MKKRYDFSDERQHSFCSNCGGLTETWDHIPPKAFLDRPLPDNLPEILSCAKCNNGFSLNEQYVACLIECTLAGTSNWRDIKRTHIALTLRRDRRIRELMEGAQQTLLNGSTYFHIDSRVLHDVVLKLARGHAAYELATPQLEEPESIFISPFVQMSSTEREAFEEPPPFTGSMLPEVGSRALQALVEGNAGWIIVQSNSYRYLTAIEETRIIVRFVIREYLACEVIWGQQ